MADQIIRTDDETPKETVVVERDSGRSNTGLIAMAIVVILLLLFWLVGNPFANDDIDTDVNVDVPTPTINTPNTNETQ